METYIKHQLKHFVVSRALLGDSVHIGLSDVYWTVHHYDS